MRDLPPKLELVLQLAPTPTQLSLLQRLVNIVQQHDRNMLRDTEVRLFLSVLVGQGGIHHVCFSQILAATTL